MTVSITLSLLLFFLAPLTVTILCYRRYSVQFPTALTFITACIIQQLAFALFARIFTYYEAALPLSIVTLILLPLFLSNRFTPTKETTQFSNRADQLIPWVLMAITLLVYLWIRTQYPFLQFYNTPDDVGVEKMFNLSLQQSFLFGKSYPPQWIWLSGEPIRYYTFLKSIPGLWSWIARVLFSDPATGGVFFILSEAFYIALIPAVVSGWILWFGRSKDEHIVHKNSIRFLAVFTALFILVGTHFRAFSMGIEHILDASTPLDWWQLTRLVPFTDNQYIGWLLMLGDNHAYSQVYFLQILFWGIFLNVLLSDSKQMALSLLCGALASSLILSHPGSVLIDISSLGFAVSFIIFYGFLKQNYSFLFTRFYNACFVIAAALFFICPLYEPAGQIKFIFPDTRLLSKTVDFLQLNFSIFIFLSLILITTFLFRSRFSLFINNIKKREWLWVFIIIFATSAYIAERPALSIMFVLSGLIFTLFAEDDLLNDQSILSLIAASSFLIWFFPEIIAFDHKLDNRTDWIRFQMSLRFWPEGFLLIPLSIALAAIKQIQEKGIHRVVMVVGAGIILIFGASHQGGMQNRIARAKQQTSLDAFQELSVRFPDDARIVTYLRNQPDDKPLVIAEACGFGRSTVPTEFGWSGRIAAFSGRLGVCGWARHAMLYNNPLRQVGFRGSDVVEKLTIYETSYLGLLESVINNNSELQNMYITSLKNFGVTHLIFGVQEKWLYPSLSISQIGTALKQTPLLINNDGTGVISIL